jgi:hypothetical protein
MGYLGTLTKQAEMHEEGNLDVIVRGKSAHVLLYRMHHRLTLTAVVAHYTHKDLRQPSVRSSS